MSESVVKEPPKFVALEIDGENLPKVFRGQWGTSKRNCAGNDDGPLLVSAKGFGHYEVTAQARRIIKISKNTIEIEFISTDAAREEVLSFQERRQYNIPLDNLIETTFDNGTSTTKHLRC